MMDKCKKSSLRVSVMLLSRSCYRYGSGMAAIVLKETVICGIVNDPKEISGIFNMFYVNITDNQDPQNVIKHDMDFNSIYLFVFAVQSQPLRNSLNLHHVL